MRVSVDTCPQPDARPDLNARANVMVPEQACALMVWDLAGMSVGLRTFPAVRIRHLKATEGYRNRRRWCTRDEATESEQLDRNCGTDVGGPGSE